MDQRTDGPGVSRIDPSDPAAPLYRLLAKMRSPVSLRDMMIIPVRTGYIGQQKAMDPADLPKSAAELYPDIKVSELDVPSPQDGSAASYLPRPQPSSCARCCSPGHRRLTSISAATASQCTAVSNPKCNRAA